MRKLTGKLRPLISVALTTALTLTCLSLSNTSPASAAGTCTRDTASDLRWIAWVHRASAGYEPDLAGAVPWLTMLSEGSTYEEVTRSIISSDAAARHGTERLYRLLLGRQPSGAEINAWAPSLRTHGSTHVAVAFLASEEAFIVSGGTNAAWVDHLYRTVVGHNPDAHGHAYWTGRLNNGGSRSSVAAAIWATQASLNLRVDEMYRSLLGRAGDSRGIQHWSRVVATRGDEAAAASMATSQAAWDAGQQAYGAAPSAMGPLCPRAMRWIPEPGTIVRTLIPVSHLGPKLAALTFDDGPNPTWTPQILDILDRYDVPATFFVTGNAARAHPDLVRRELAEGHRLAVHSMSHPNLLTLGRDAQYREIAGSVSVVDGIVGPGQVRCFRPPYGNRNATTDSIAASLGLSTIMWSRDGRDWASPGVDHIVNANLDTFYDGGRALLLLHDGGIQRSQTVAALPKLIDALRARGYQFVQIC